MLAPGPRRSRRVVILTCRLRPLACAPCFAGRTPFQRPASNHHRSIEPFGRDRSVRLLIGTSPRLRLGAVANGACRCIRLMELVQVPLKFTSKVFTMPIKDIERVDDHCCRLTKVPLGCCSGEADGAVKSPKCRDNRSKGAA